MNFEFLMVNLHLLAPELAVECSVLKGFGDVFRVDAVSGSEVGEVRAIDILHGEQLGEIDLLWLYRLAALEERGGLAKVCDGVNF